MKPFLALALVLVGCAGTASSVGRVNDAERMKKGLVGKDAQTLAPQAYAKAEAELKLAREADAAGDALGAELHADRAMASFADAVALARLSRATEDEKAANEMFAKASEQVAKWSTQRKTTDHEADDLEKQLRIAREAQLPAASGTADPEREAARRVAAASLVQQAHLLCSAARLVSTTAPGLAEAETTVTTLEKGTPTIDPAARARAACLSSLTKARRANSADGSDQGDALLTELSNAGSSPIRDERGVIVTVRSAFKGTALSTEAEKTFADLGRVAAAHGTFAVQVVVHDAESTPAADDAKRAEAVQKALVGAGADASKLKLEQAGTKSPVVDPRDAKRREKNARVEVVFVGKD